MQKGASEEKEYGSQTWKADGFMVANKTAAKPLYIAPKAKTDEWWMASGHDNIIAKKEQKEAKAYKKPAKKGDKKKVEEKKEATDDM